jgi:SAM-dependent methyltransferase
MSGMPWQWKCFVDSCKGIIPFQNQLRDIKYQLVPYIPDDFNNRETIEQGLGQLVALRELHSLENAFVLEVGSGWQPLIPALFSLAGASCVYLTDLRRLCHAASFGTALAALRKYRSLILDKIPMGEDAFDRALAWDPATGLDAGLRHLRLKYLAPCDCQKLDLPSGSVDIVISRAALEHIPPAVIQGIFRESFRLLRPGGLACHLVDNSDHWEHRDKRISRVNFLKYSDAVFRWTYLNGLNYQNRLRHPEYGEMLTKAGLSIVRNEPSVSRESVEALKTLPVHERFKRFTVEELASVGTIVVARR